MRTIVLTLLCLGSLLSCSTTPATRIARNQPLYQALPEDHQELVARGQIAVGMEPQAVFLALGHPDRKLFGQRQGRSFERWDYQTVRPTLHASLHSGWGWDHGYFGLGPEVAYLPQLAGIVIFENKKVTEWEWTH